MTTERDSVAYAARAALVAKDAYLAGRRDGLVSACERFAFLRALVNPTASELMSSLVTEHRRVEIEVKHLTKLLEDNP